ncbi:heme lyase CcmF/NrfE family subunit [Shewanella sp. UCD-KL12]|uniref:heme lyase CcmF/NrfE family subunit n=1 Tax=Shewanella sp. UCD-KL12 TaxID=1917163 RepID=UPI000970629E|nr:heme lyase CcmF/NrfE family subunit [Shewanella sp. UCD-KL12]
MVPELGLIFLIVSTIISILLGMITFIGSYKNNHYLLSYVKTLTGIMTFSLCASITCLLISFVVDDFTVAYVANNSNTQLALIYKVAAIWGGHEGSMLFWVVAMAVWGCIITFSGKYQDRAFIGRFIAVLSFVIAGFCLFMLFTSNPFARLLPNYPIEGRDLNPILQDIGLILHPPMLFLGYVGLTICFAAAISALLGEGLTKQKAAYLRPWAITAWVFLTGGNAFGSWWAYNELGWGGWWFWDPVENASFIPWLVATGLVHSVNMTHKRGLFGSTTIFLCILAFSLSLLGTFLVRSGVVQSVHAFASDPTRGFSILVLLLTYTGAALALFAYKSSNLNFKIDFSALSKESLLLLGNLLLVAAALSVLLGTCYPIIYEVATGATISVGPPYFNSIFIPIAVCVFILMGLTPLIRWQSARVEALRTPAVMALISLTLACVFTFTSQDEFSIWLLLGAFSVLWILSCVLLSLKQFLSHSAHSSYQAVDKRSRARFLGMCFAHLGVALSVFGATCVSNFEQEELLRMGPGNGKEVAGYTFVYEETQHVDRASFTAIQAKIMVLDKHENIVTYIYPQRQTFKTNAMEMSAAGIHSSLFGDLYVSMGVALSETEYLIRISYKPFVNWLWIGALFMMLAGCSIIYNLRPVKKSKQARCARNMPGLQTRGEVKP